MHGHMPPTPMEAAVMARVEVRSPRRIRSGIGTLQAVHQVTVAPEVGGRVVTQIFFDPGATVNAGDPLVQLYDAALARRPRQLPRPRSAHGRR